jgi:hypothetical protein
MQRIEFPRCSKAAQHSPGGSIQSASQSAALVPLLSLLLIAVLAIALPLHPAVCSIAATGLCYCVVLVRILLALLQVVKPHHTAPRPVGVRFMVGAGINNAWRKQHGGLALNRCYEVFRSLQGLEIHWNGSQGSP